MPNQTFRKGTSRFVKRFFKALQDEEPEFPDELVEEYERFLTPELTTVYDYLESHVVENEQAELVQFELRKFQRKLVDLILDCWRQGKAAYIIIIKARQLGFSTLIEMLLAEGIERHPGCKAITVAHDNDATEELFRKVSYTLEQVPDLVKQRIGIMRVARSGRRIAYRHYPRRGSKEKGFRESSCRVVTARKRQGTRSATVQRGHLSEYAHWENLTRIDAYQQSVHDRPGNFLIIETTAFGNNLARDLWNDACAGRGDWIPFFVAWWEHELYTRPFKDAKERAEFIASIGRRDPWRYGGKEEIDLIEGRVGYVLRGRKYGFVPLTPEQLHWRRYWIDNKCKGVLAFFHQEMPSYPEEAFQTSGLPVFDTVKLKLYEEAARRMEYESKPYQLDWDQEFLTGGLAEDYYQIPALVRENPLGLLVIFKMPEPGMRCVMGSDVAEGLETLPGGGDTDYSTCYVRDAVTGERYARYRGRPDTSLFAEDLFKLSRFYGDAWLMIEANGPGLAVIKLLEKDGFRRLLNRPRAEATTEGKREAEMRPGFKTTRTSKPFLISKLEARVTALSPPSEHLPEWSPFDRLLIEEMLCFVKSGMGKMAAEGGKHDDLVIAAALAELAAEETPDDLLTEVQPDLSEAIRQIGRIYTHPEAEPYEPEEEYEPEEYRRAA